MSDRAAAGPRGEWPLKQRGRNSGAVGLCDLDPAAGMLTLDWLEDEESPAWVYMRGDGPARGYVLR